MRFTRCRTICRPSARPESDYAPNKPRAKRPILTCILTAASEVRQSAANSPKPVAPVIPRAIIGGTPFLGQRIAVYPDMSGPCRVACVRKHQFPRARRNNSSSGNCPIDNGVKYGHDLLFAAHWPHFPYAGPRWSLVLAKALQIRPRFVLCLKRPGFSRQ